jgi:hypothetical protein
MTIEELITVSNYFQKDLQTLLQLVVFYMMRNTDMNFLDLRSDSLFLWPNDFHNKDSYAYWYDAYIALKLRTGEKQRYYRLKDFLFYAHKL